MKLLEYEAKSLLRSSGFPIPRSELIIRKNNIPSFFPVVIKSQVLTGGRGKRGGIIIQESRNDTEIEALFKKKINSLLPPYLLAEEKLVIEHEFYFSLMIDRDSQGIQLLISKNGGVEVEDADIESFARIVVSQQTRPTIGERIAELYDIPGKGFLLQELFEKALSCFIANDATLLEINPFILTQGGKLVAGDCKMTLDNAAGFRHPDWDFYDTASDNNFVILDPKGTVATIANGAGLAMATVDAVEDAGLIPANFLDIGGGATEASVLAAFKKIMEFEYIEAIVINIFAGITRCDEVAKAIIAAQSQLEHLPKLYIRLAGTNYDTAREILNEHGFILLPSLEKCIVKVAEEVSK